MDIRTAARKFGTVIMKIVTSEEYDDSEKENFLSNLSYALEKQNPKAIQIMNMRIDKDNCYRWVCPNCGASRNTRYRTHYCSYCGQRIDWSGYLKMVAETAPKGAITDDDIEQAGKMFPELELID